MPLDRRPLRARPRRRWPWAGRGLPCALALVAAAGCASLPAVPHPHIVVDPEGYAITAERQRLDNPTFQATVVAGILADVDREVDRAAAAGKVAQVMLYAHGGLTTYKGGLDFIRGIVTPDGHVAGTRVYPVFVNWDSSFATALWDDLVEIRGGERMPFGPFGILFSALSTPLVVARRVGTSLLDVVKTLGFQLDAWWKATAKSEPLPGSEGVGHGIANTTTLVLGTPASVFAAGFGAGQWDMMKRRVDRMFALHEDGVRKGTLWKGATRLLLEAVARRARYPGHWETPSGSRPVRLVLAGHSMGTLVADRVLHEFPAIAFDRIVHLGSASSQDDFRMSVLPYLERHPLSRFVSVSLSVRDEEEEKNAAVVVPMGSLLVWIDQMFEPALGDGQKRLGRWLNMKRLKIEPGDETVCARATFLKLPLGGPYPRRHQEFNDPEFLGPLLRLSDATWPEGCPCCTRYDACAIPAPVAFTGPHATCQLPGASP